MAMIPCASRSKQQSIAPRRCRSRRIRPCSNVSSSLTLHRRIDGARGTAMLKLRMLALGAALLLTSMAARAQLQIDITRGVTDPVPVAVVPFAGSAPGSDLLDVATVIERDLESSGRFRRVDRGAMPARPTR